MNELEETMRERLKKNQFMSYNHIELEHVEPDYAVFRLDIRPESRNIFGMVHGGALYTMADNAAGSAAHTDGRNYVTQNGSLHFLRNQTEGTVRATGRVRHRRIRSLLPGETAVPSLRCPASIEMQGMTYLGGLS